MYIDQIDLSVSNAEINVLESLIQSYDKSIMILENSDDTVDVSSFDIFQEGDKWDKFKEDTKAPVLGNKGESKLKRILMIIPRLIQKLIALITKFIKSPKITDTIDKLKKIDKASESDIDSVFTEGFYLEGKRTKPWPRVVNDWGNTPATIANKYKKLNGDEQSDCVFAIKTKRIASNFDFEHLLKFINTFTDIINHLIPRSFGTYQEVENEKFFIEKRLSYDGFPLNIEENNFKKPISDTPISTFISWYNDIINQYNILLPIANSFKVQIQNIQINAERALIRDQEYVSILGEMFTIVNRMMNKLLSLMNKTAMNIISMYADVTDAYNRLHSARII